MKLELFDVDEFVSINHLQEVTSPVLFQRGDVPHPNGLISNQIFGITTRDRKRKFAYIDLHAHYFQPHVYIALKFLFSGIDSLINGSENYSIDKVGQLVKDPEGDTGLDFIYTNWEKIKWLKKDGGTGGMRDERIALLTKTPKNLIFMDKQIVIPPFYRDIKSSAGGGGETSDLNNYYANIIRFASRNQDKDMFGFTFHATNYSIQDNINNIYQYFRTKLEKKQGMFRKYLMGKTVDNAVRTVITAPTYHANDPDDLMVDYNHAAVPISQLCVELYPFVVSWLKNFFDREFIENKYTKTYWSPDNDTEAIIELDSPETYFNDKFIDTMINRYIKNPESRFDPIELPVKGNKKKYIAFRGKRIHSDSKADVSTIAYRPMTVTDLLYIACCDVSKDKHILVTRYPLLDSFGVFINKINVMSTTKTEVVDINGEIYKWYPKIDFSVPKSEIGCLFDDSLKFSNSYLKGIGGDYDGDQTTGKIVWTQEANKELEELINSKKFFLNINGGMMRSVGNEITQTFYMFTKEPTAKDRTITGKDLEWLLSKESKDFTFDTMVKMFGELVDNTERLKDGVPKFNCTDKMTVSAAQSPTRQKLDTTVGRWVFNKVLVERSGCNSILGYINAETGDKAFGTLEVKLSQALLDDKITTEQMVHWINIRDWLGLEMHAVITTSFSPGVIKTPPEVKKLKAELIKKYKKELEAGDTKVSEMIENELIKKTKEVLKDDWGMDLYNSGSRGSVNNNLKNINMMRGAIKNPGTGEYDIVTASLMDGMNKKDIPASSNSIVSGAYPKHELGQFIRIENLLNCWKLCKRQSASCVKYDQRLSKV